MFNTVCLIIELNILELTTIPSISGIVEKYLLNKKILMLGKKSLLARALARAEEEESVFFKTRLRLVLLFICIAPYYYSI